MNSTNKRAGVSQKRIRPLIPLIGLPLILSLLLVSAPSGRAETSGSETVKTQRLATYGRLPLSFEANQGQTDAQVKFLSRGRGYSLFLTPNEAVLVLRKAEGARQQASEKTDSALSTQNSELSSVVRMKLAGANPQPRVVGLSELPGKVNYFIGNDPAKWRTNVPTYAKVKYAGVYPGVDAVYYGNQGQLEYDLIVAPGTDPKTIALAFEGAEKLELDEKGDLVLQIAGGELRLRKPLVYQEIGGVRKEISAAYVLDPNPKSKIANPKSASVGFQVASYDASKPLIIDPVLVYSTYLGGTGADQGFGVAVNTSGNAFVVGSSASVTFNSAAHVDLGPGGGNDAFVAKLNATGSALDYLTFVGGSTEDQGFGIAVESSSPGCAGGCAYITGRTNSTNFPLKNAVQTSKSGSASTFDAFVTKLNECGSLDPCVVGGPAGYSTYLGGSQDESGNGIALDSANRAYVVGQTKSTNFPAKNALRSKNGGVTDVFVAKLDPALVGAASLIYATYLGGSGDDTGNGIAVDGSFNVYITGETASSNFPVTTGAFDTTFNGLVDAFVAKLNSTGSSLLYSTYLGGSGADRGRGIGVESSSSGCTTGGCVYVTGSTESAGLASSGAYDNTISGQDAFVAKLKLAGAGATDRVYFTYLGGGGNDIGNAIAVDSSGNAYVTGGTLSNNFPAVAAIQAALAPGDVGGDAFVAKLNAAGSDLVYSTFLGGSGADQGFGIALDASLNAYVTGSTASSNFPIASFQAALGGGTDAFVTKLAPNTPPVLSGVATAATIDELVQYTFTATATDSDNPVQTLTFSLVGAPAGAAIGSSTGVFNWTPSEAQGPGVYAFKVRVTDNGTPALFDENTITITVREVNTAPLLSGVPTTATINELVPYSFTASATDSDIPAQTLTFSLVGAPTGATFGSSTGVFNWTPSEAQGPGKYSFTVRVSDGVANTDAGIAITVNEVNTAPSLAAIGNKTVDELTLLSFTAVGSDTDVPAQTLTYSLASGITSCSSVTSCAVPSGASINSGTGAFIWTPTEDQGPGTYRFKVVVTDNGTPNLSASEEITVTVNEVNTAPTLAAIGNKTVDELTLLSFTAAGSDTDVPAQTLTYSLAIGITSCGSVTSCAVPSGASINSGTGAFTWTPTEDQGPGTYRFKVVVTDNGTPNLSASEEITVTVNGVNEKPVASANPASLTGAAAPTEDAAPTTVALSGSDAETAPEDLVFTITQAPANGVLKMGATTLLFGSTFTGSPTNVTYQPNANFNGSDSFKFKVTDTGDGSSAALDSDEVTVSITVNAVNDPPFFNSILDQVPITDAFVSQTLVVDITGVSPGPADEVAGQTVALTASVISSSPAGLVTITNADGSANPSGSVPVSGSTATLSYQIPAIATGTATIRVTADDGQGAGNNNTFSRDFSVTVAADPVAAAAITGLKLGSAFVNYKVTFNPVDRNGDGIISSLDCYSVFPPQPQDNPYNLFPSNALVTPEAPPAAVADTFDTLGFGTTQVCTTPRIFEGVIDLSVWGITELGGLTIDFTYVNAVKDPELTAVVGGNAVCVDGATTCQNILVGSFPAGSIAFTFGGTVSEINTVLLHSVELHSGNSSKKPLADVEARVFNRDDNKFQNQVFVVNGKKVKVGQNPSGSLYGAIFESGVGEIAHCHTPGSGICLTTETQVGNYLVIIKFVDSDVTHDGGKIVYEGETLSATSFLDTSVPPDGIGDTAQVGFEIIRKNNNGVFQEYQGGSKTVVCNLSSPSCVP
jgi:hypothetical protein